MCSVDGTRNAAGRGLQRHTLVGTCVLGVSPVLVKDICAYHCSLAASELVMDNVLAALKCQLLSCQRAAQPFPRAEESCQHSYVAKGVQGCCLCLSEEKLSVGLDDIRSLLLLKPCCDSVPFLWHCQQPCRSHPGCRLSCLS